MRIFLNRKKRLHYQGKVNLIFTSPPFPLNRKKKYGNYQGEEYVEWITNICKKLADYLSEDGSLVIEVGNSWEEGTPTMSTLAIDLYYLFYRNQIFTYVNNLFGTIWQSFQVLHNG